MGAFLSSLFLDLMPVRRQAPRWFAARVGLPGGLTTALVAGPSMLPTLRPGDALVVRRGGRVRAGALVVARPVDRPELLVVKRAVRPAAGPHGIWEVAADNPAVAGYGWTAGPAHVLGRVLLRYWPLPPTLLTR